MLECVPHELDKGLNESIQFWVASAGGFVGDPPGCAQVGICRTGILRVYNRLWSYGPICVTL